MKKSLLKIGTLYHPGDRWLDVLSLFDDVTVFCYEDEVHLQDPHFHYIQLDRTKGLNPLFLRALYHYNTRMHCEFLVKMIVSAIRLFNLKTVKQVEKVHADFIHSSYNDFDKSYLLTMLVHTKQTITRVQKETRPAPTVLEKLCLQKCSRLGFNEEACYQFYASKYPGMLDKKEIVTDVDEDARSERLQPFSHLSPKLSIEDGRVHAVILAGRVLSTSSDVRSGGRLYYLDTIKRLLAAGFVVHLHTPRIIPFNGYEPYTPLSKENSDFHIEGPLDFEHDPTHAYQTLSRYDVGILHAYIHGTDVQRFDQVNIPNRYYEYLIAHVCPIAPRGENEVLAKLFTQKHTGILYQDLSDLTLQRVKEVQYPPITFKAYFKRLYC